MFHGASPWNTIIKRTGMDRQMDIKTKRQLFSESKHLELVKFSPVRQVMDKMREYINQGKDVIPFQIGEPDFFTPDTIIQSTKIALDKKMTHYAPNRGTIGLRRAVASQLSQRGLVYDPEDELLITVGGTEAIFDGIFAFINEGDEVIVPTPSYMNYKNDIAMAGGICVELVLRAGNGFQIDPDELESMITTRTRMVVLNNPSNPTGVVFTKDVLKAVASIAIAHDLIVFSDEIYDEILYDGIECVSIATFDGMRERTIVMNGFSKSYAMTGWRVGYLAAPAVAIRPMLKVHQYAVTCIPTFIQEGLSQAMNQVECLLEKEEMFKAFAQKRALLFDCLKTVPELTYTIPYGAFYVFLDVSKTGLDGNMFASRLLQEQYVAVVPGVGFSSNAENYIRLSFATSEGNIINGIKRIRAFIDSLS